MSIPLPRIPPTNVPRQPVWSVVGGDDVETITVDRSPIGDKCGLVSTATIPADVPIACCKTLKGDDERHLVSPAVVRDIVIGLSDGLTVPFALTAGLSSLGSSRLVVTAGLAELIAGAISMGVGGYLASQAELDHFHYVLRQTKERVQRSCASEMEREVHSIIGPLGIKESLSRLVTEDLRRAEDEILGIGIGIVEGVDGVEGGRSSGQAAACDQEKRSKSRNFFKRTGTPSNPDRGLTAFLLKYGEGQEEVPRSRLYISALTIGLAYFIGGLIPLIPYLANTSAQTGLIISSAITGTVLLIFGAFKTYYTGAKGGIGGYAWGAISTLLVGGGAAVAAYFLVKALHVQE